MGLNCPSCGYDNVDDALACNLCQNVLRKAVPRSPAPAPAASPLPYAGWAAQVVASGPKDMMLLGLGIELDGSAASVAGIDASLEALYGNEGEAPDQDLYKPSKGKENIILGYGAYFGEVCIRILDGSWTDDPKNPGNPLWARVSFDAGNAHLFPFTRLYQRFKGGAENALFPLLLAVTKDRPELRKAWAKDFLKQAKRVAERGAMPVERRLPVAKQFCAVASACDPGLHNEANALEEGLDALAASAAKPKPAPPPGSAQDARAKEAFDMLVRATRTMQAGRPAESLPLFDQALELGPEDAQAWQNKGVALCQLGRFEEALAVVAKACEMVPTELGCWTTRSSILIELKRWADAALILRKVTELAPDDAGQWHERGWVCNNAGKFDEALDCLTRCLELRQDGDPVILLEKAAVLDKAGRLAEAVLVATMTFKTEGSLDVLKAKGLKGLTYLVSKESSPTFKALVAKALG